MDNSRIRVLTLEDLQQLQLIAKQGYIQSSGSFWMSVEKALEDEASSIQLHKCTCGHIVVSSPDYVQSCKDLHIRNKKEGCWHKEGVLDSIGPHNLMVSRRVDHIVNTLNEDIARARQLSVGLLPISGPKNFDYSLFKLEFALWYQSSKLERKNSPTTLRLIYLEIFEKLQARARKKNEAEYLKALNFYINPQQMIKLQESLKTALDKHNEANNIIAEEAYKRITNQFSPANRPQINSKDNALKLSEQIDLDSYQAFFEIRETLEIIYNFVVIENGGFFDPNPFRNKRLKNGTPVEDKKAYMVQKIVEESKNKKLSELLIKAYDNQLRNNTSGHNDYIVNLRKKIITIKSKKINYSFKYVDEVRYRIIAAVTSLVSSIHFMKHYDNNKELSLLGIHTISPGFKDTKVLSPLPDLITTQFWNNAGLDKKGDHVTCLNIRLSKDRKYLYFSHNEMMSDEALKFPPSQQFIEWLVSVKEKDSIHYDRIVIAPKIELFLQNAKAELTIDGFEYFVIGKTHHIIKLNKPQITRIIKLLKNKQLPSLNTTKLSEIISIVKNYKDQKINLH